MNTFQAAGRFAAIVSAIALVATPAFAASNDPTAPAKSDRKASQLYCVKDEITGSRMPRTVCKTRDEWISQYGFDPVAKH